jgi:hypothetical protein
VTDRYEHLHAQSLARAALPGIKCSGCGQFIAYSAITAGEAGHRFEPLSEFGPEISEWFCAPCAKDCEL